MILELEDYDICDAKSVFKHYFDEEFSNVKFENLLKNSNYTLFKDVVKDIYFCDNGRNVDQEFLNNPIIALELDHGIIILDGNHRAKTLRKNNLKGYLLKGNSLMNEVFEDIEGLEKLK